MCHIKDITHSPYEVSIYEALGQFAFDIKNEEGEVLESLSGFESQEQAEECAYNKIYNE